MRFCLLVHLLLLSIGVSASEIVFSPITAHTTNYDGVGQNFPKKIDKEGYAVFAPVLGYRLITQRSSDYAYVGTIIGLNSVFKPMIGFVWGLGMAGETYRLGLISGAYIQSNRQFRALQIQPYSIGETKNGQGIVPVIGLEYSKKISKKSFTNMVISPMIVNVGLGYIF